MRSAFVTTVAVLVVTALGSVAARAQRRTEPRAPARPSAEAGPRLEVEQLLIDGWEIAGYGASFDSRSLILFKHKDKHYLVQCSVLYDVTRTQRVATNCYEIR